MIKSTPKTTGTLKLSVVRRDHQTVPDNVFFQGAFKLMRPQYLDSTGQVMYCLLNPGGGYLDGDRYHLEVTVGANADLYLTAQSATKIYKTPDDCVRQVNKLTVGENGILEFTADPVIAFENATYFQEQTIDLTPSSSLFITDMVTPGWSRDGKGFQYNSVTLKTQISINGHIRVIDNLVLNPAELAVQSMGMLETHTHYAGVYLIDPRIKTETEETLAQLLSERFPETAVGVSQLAIPGLAIRILGEHTQEVKAVADACQYFFRRQILKRDNELFQKY
ncbi:urease accessory protein UreD [Secundilactobacillus collinoides]|uniref:Urease accessory protein UreD n=1 Tax=Secundilactobacillus collinoides DSM 20515 = JCM 1123 TaxID=1423733 RepID=A0A0R2BKZ8_SECCO|nr:urease accessory protein UreD [Secundilactobacillus collinoides]KRM76683.1 hypothetical protein FC82_GL001164 [Secundilactobacillus collinoides DSM 20515 = JCM 1123]